MRKLFFVLIFSCVCNVSIAQGGLTYTPFFGETNQRYEQVQPQHQSQRYRITAYQVDYDGNYVKIPIIVTCTKIRHVTGDTSQEIHVTSYYNYQYREWKNISYGGAVYKCSSFGGGLDQMFMYKASLGMIGTVWFDL